MTPFLSGLDWLSGQTAGVILFGLISAGLGLLLDRFLIRRRRTPAPVSAPTTDPDGEGGKERRIWPRLQSAPAKVVLVREGGPAEPLEGWVLDTSLGGVGLSAPEPVEVGAVLSLRPADAAEAVRRGRVEVLYCRLHRGRWRLGCRFVSSSPPPSV